jgi:hypothetical protein
LKGLSSSLSTSSNGGPNPQMNFIGQDQQPQVSHLSNVQKVQYLEQQRQMQHQLQQIHHQANPNISIQQQQQQQGNQKPLPPHAQNQSLYQQQHMPVQPHLLHQQQLQQQLQNQQQLNMQKIRQQQLQQQQLQQHHGIPIGVNRNQVTNKPFLQTGSIPNIQQVQRPILQFQDSTLVQGYDFLIDSKELNHYIHLKLDLRMSG